jgi:hypothetical protein
MPERGTFKGEMKGLGRVIKQMVTPEPVRWSYDLEKWQAVDEENDRKLRENDFQSNAEAEYAYWPLTREQWLQQEKALKRMDKAYCLMEDILGDSITPQQREYFNESVEIEEMVIREINEDNWPMKLTKFLIEEWRNPKAPGPLIEDQQ